MIEAFQYLLKREKTCNAVFWNSIDHKSSLVNVLLYPFDNKWLNQENVKREGKEVDSSGQGFCKNKHIIKS